MSEIAIHKAGTGIKSEYLEPHGINLKGYESPHLCFNNPMVPL